MSGSKMLADVFHSCAAERRAAIIPFIAAGDPDFDATIVLARAAAEAGADIIELGFPFSDPVADGPVIQQAYARALAGGATTGRSLQCARQIAGETARPVVLMTSLNVVLAYTASRFYAEAADAGVAAVLVPDLLAEDAGMVAHDAARSGIATVFLAGPGTAEERLRTIVASSTGFVYVVRRSGVTGSGEADAELGERLAALRAMTSLPLAVGFGVSTPADVGAICEIADGVIVGSALVGAAHDAGVRAPEAVAGLVRAMALAARRPTARETGRSAGAAASSASP
jgi:tryptophan synthase alpha chain